MALSPIYEEKVPMLHSQPVEYDDVDVDIEDSSSDTTRVGTSPFHCKSFRSPSRCRSTSSSWLSTFSTSHSQTPPHQPLSSTILTWSRWTVIILLQTIMITLLLQLHPNTAQQQHHYDETSPLLRGRTVETGDDVNGLHKTTSHTYTHLTPDPTTYIPNMTHNTNRASIRRNWDALMPRGSGSLSIPSHLSHPLLGAPITDDPLRTGVGPIYEAAWTHSLHCLYHLVDSYHQLLLLASPLLPPYPEFNASFSHTPNPAHYAHCTEYLRTSILCNLDMTLEGSASTQGEKARGQAHVCRDREEVVRWIEERRVDDRRDIVGPDAIPAEV